MSCKMDIHVSGCLGPWRLRATCLEDLSAAQKPGRMWGAAERALESSPRRAESESGGRTRLSWCVFWCRFSAADNCCTTCMYAQRTTRRTLVGTKRTRERVSPDAGKRGGGAGGGWGKGCVWWEVVPHCRPGRQGGGGGGGGVCDLSLLRASVIACVQSQWSCPRTTQAALTA